MWMIRWVYNLPAEQDAKDTLEEFDGVLAGLGCSEARIHCIDMETVCRQKYRHHGVVEMQTI